MTSTPRALRLARFCTLAGIALGLGAAYHFGVFTYLGEPRKLARALVDMGGWGHLAFFLAYALLQPFGVPGTLFIVAAPLIWPWKTAFALSMAGTLAASVIGFWFARFMARDWVSERIPARLRRYDAALEQNAFQTVVILRLLLWMPQVLHGFFGISRVSGWTHFWGSVVGYAPTLFIVSYLGGEMFEPSGAMKPGAWPILLGLFALSVAVAVLARLYNRRVRADRGKARAVSPASRPGG